MSALSLSEAEFILCLFFIFLVPLAGAGFALVNTGLGRSRNAAHSMVSSLAVMGIAALGYFVCGFAFQGYSGQPAHVITLSGHPWNWLAAGPFFFHHFAFDGSPASLAACLQLFSVGIAAIIPLGSGADRWRLSAICASTALLACLVYPLFAHWIWGGGWLAELGVQYGLGNGCIDVGGSGSIHAVGGLAALSIAWILSARRGKYASQGMPNAIPGHNTVLVLFGCVLTLVGCLGLNCAGAILFAGSGISKTPLVAVNTILAAASSVLITLLVTRIRFGKPDASLVANGWVAGIVAISSGCAFVQPAAAVVIGAIAGILVPLSVELLELRAGLDDPGGAVSVHALGGIWGLLATGFFTRFSQQVSSTANHTSSQWLAQIAGIATLIGFILPLTYGLNWTVNRFYPYRVASEGERQGLDIYELGGGAYPEFVTQSDEFLLR